MRIGITGVTGFIGTALAKAAMALGHEVVGFSRRKNLVLSHAGEVRLFDESASSVLDPDGLDVLVHLSGENVLGYWIAEKKKRIHDSRIKSTQGIVAALRECRHRPHSFICASATGFYGNRGDEVLTDTSARGEGFLAGVCADWESAALEAEASGTRVALLRTGLVLGQKGGAWPLLRLLFSLCLGSRLGNGKQWVPWIHLDDEVGIILHAIENPTICGPVNLTSPNPVTNAQLTRAIAQRLGRITMPPVPAFMLRLVMGEMGGVLLDSQRVLPNAVLDHGYRFLHPELDGALAELDQKR